MANLLELTTLVSEQPSTIKIDGESYDLKPASSFKFGALSMIQHAQKFIQKFLEDDEVRDEKAYEEAGKVMARVIQKIVDAPVEVLVKLSFVQQSEIVMVWGKVNKTEKGDGDKTTDPLPENSEKSSQPSADSTEEVPEHG